jgi:predicted AlkP superfamily pyrophosphatase or phosphodiesterase
MSPTRRLEILGLLVVLLLAGLSSAATSETPRLVVLVAIDQLRPDRIRTDLPGGLGRLLREGRVYEEAALDHAMTETCPGHVTMLTGRNPGPAGIPGNSFLDAENSRRVYCTEDDPEDAAVIGFEKIGRSPRNLRVTALGDWMKQANEGSRVVSLSAKDRAAIVMGGQRPDLVYWFSEKGDVGFTSSRHYTPELPGWVRAFNGEPSGSGVMARVPERWEHDPESVKSAPRPDDFDGEDDRYRDSSGHPIHSDDVETFAKQVFASPFIDELTLDFARELVQREGLGRDETPDLLALSLSGQDIVGHLYGPYSHESADALARLDVALGAFLEFLESTAGEGRVLVALTADHGVLPLPEWLTASGQQQCPDEDGRAGLKGMALGLYWNMHWALKPLSLPRPWVEVAGWQVGVKRSLAESRGVPVEKAVAAARRYLEKQPTVERVWTREDMETEKGELADLYRNSFAPERSGDLIVQVREGCLISFFGSGTTHGTPYWYDRHVPLIFWGPGIEAGRIREGVATVDIAPTLAKRLGVAPPSDLDGRPLF